METTMFGADFIEGVLIAVPPSRYLFTSFNYRVYTLQIASPQLLPLGPPAVSLCIARTFLAYRKMYSLECILHPTKLRYMVKSWRGIRSLSALGMNQLVLTAQGRISIPRLGSTAECEGPHIC